MSSATWSLQRAQLCCQPVAVGLVIFRCTTLKTECANGPTQLAPQPWFSDLSSLCQTICRPGTTTQDTPLLDATLQIGFLVPPMRSKLAIIHLSWTSWQTWTEGTGSPPSSSRASLTRQLVFTPQFPSSSSSMASPSISMPISSPYIPSLWSAK